MNYGAHDAERIVRDFLDCWHRLDLDGALAHMADDAVFVPDPKGERTIGRDALRALWGGYIDGFAAYDCTIGAIAGHGRLAFVERVERIATKRGATMTLPIVGVFEIDAAGRIAAWRDYWDTAMAPA